MPVYMAPLPSGVEDIGAWRIDDRLQAAATEPRRRRLFRAAAVAEPGQQIRPPAALLRPGLLEPFLRIGRVGLAGLVGRLRIRRRIHERRDVTAGGQDEPALSAEQLGAAVAVLPRRDVVG